MIVTIKTLKDKGACSDYVKVFNRLFPNGVRVTQATCVRYATHFDWDWAVTHLIPGGGYHSLEAFEVLTREARMAWRNAVFTEGTRRDVVRLGNEYARAQARAFALLIQRPKLRNLGREMSYDRVSQRG